LVMDLENAWWCETSDTEWRDGDEVPKVAPPSGFFDPDQFTTARKEFTKLSEIGRAKIFLGKRVLQWAAEAPDDPRIPEALFIAFKANVEYRYGCYGGDESLEIQQQAAELLHEQYAQSPWTGKLSALEGP